MICMNWDWFYNLYSIASVVTIVGVLWRIAIIPLALLSLAFNVYVQRIFMFIVMLIPNYFIASYSVLVGLYINEGEKSWVILGLGLLFILMHELTSIIQAKDDAIKSVNYEAFKAVNLRYWIIPITAVYYIYSIFNPQLAINSSTTWVANVISWIQNLPIVGWIIAIVAFIYVIYMIFVFITFLLRVISSAFSNNVTSNPD